MHRWTGVVMAAALIVTARPCAAPARMPAQALATTVPTCTFSWPSRTLRDDLASADMVLTGTLTNATPANPEGAGEGVTDFLVGRSLKLPPGFRAEKTIVLDRYLPNANKGGFLLFFGMSKGKPEAYQGIPLKANSGLPNYVAGILKIKDQKPSKRLRFYFNHLGSKEAMIADDALLEVQRSNYKDVREVAGSLSADKLVAWLRTPGIRPDRIGYFAFLLAHCSKDRAKHARLLRSLVGKCAAGNLDRLLIGYVLLDSKEGLHYVRSILQDAQKDFMLRYAAIEALRFFMDSRPGLLPRQDVLEAVALVLVQEDVADLAIEDFRRWKCWEMTPHVLALANSKPHDVPIFWHTLLRFALCSPRQEAKQFVAEKRKDDPETVEACEEMLKLEQVPAPLPK